MGGRTFLLAHIPGQGQNVATQGDLSIHSIIGNMPPMKILLVDDSKSARYALRLQLQRHNVEVETADSAESAFEILKTQLPDAILMDHMMPGLNGFEALDVIREDPRTAQIPVIMCTSHEEPEFVATANKKGVFGILPKSAAADLLPDILDKLHASLAAPGTSAPVEAVSKPVMGATASGLSEDAITRLINARVDERLTHLLTPMLDDLRRHLTEGLQNDVRQILDDRLAAEQAARRTAAPPPTMADLQAISTRLATETLPDLLRRGIEAERGHLMEAVKAHLRDAAPASGAAARHERGEESDQALLARTEAMARRAAQEAVESALITTQQSLQATEQALRGAIGRLHGLIAVAAILGIGAAGLVFFLLRT
ncbi:response regulator receiver domain-containing protein [Thiobaca trueperi]|uniref:Response regulator receiver domain-containing protein n=2 Tax=Thiobaca trueperi TaxID=127458 RepID=A0A4R3N1Q1_9GAMM|nr:response regulator receiver domain-containing protein [Thiobaca trueperi]